MKSKNSKKALIVSAAAISLSAVLFAGTTYAWFTDSAKSGTSVIKSGNLKASLQIWNGTEYVDVTDSTDVLAVLAGTDTLWEPGHTEVAYLKVSNTGSLALKYQLSVSVLSETAGTNAAGDAYNLSDYLVFSQITSDTPVTYANRSDARAAAGTSLGLKSYTEENTLYPNGSTLGDSEQYIALVVYMPESVGNEANPKTGTAMPTISLGTVLSATQAPVEKDSYDQFYDDGLSYPAASTGQLTDSIGSAENGQTITVAAGTFELAANINKQTTGVTISGSGPDQTVFVVNGDDTTTSAKGNGYIIQSEGTTISNATIEGQNITNGSWNSLLTINTNNVTLDNLAMTGGGQGTWNASVLIQNRTAGGVTTVSNSNISGSFRAVFAESQVGDVVVDNCVLEATYPINVDGGGDFGLYVTNSHLKGWTSYANMTKGAHFTNTTFSMGSSGYDTLAVYSDTTLTNCTFDASFRILDRPGTSTFTLTNCTKDGVKVTAENFAQLFATSDLMGRSTVYVDGILVDWAA
jgi:predicted ribosomally synthesized peptide with SipW-like signal peptide